MEINRNQMAQIGETLGFSRKEVDAIRTMPVEQLVIIARHINILNQTR